MKLPTEAQDPQAGPHSSRADARAARSTLLRTPAARRRPARRPGRQGDSRHVEAAPGSCKSDKQGDRCESTPPFGLTLRADGRDAPPAEPRPGRSALAVVSVGSAGIGLLPGSCSGGFESEPSTNPPCRRRRRRQAKRWGTSAKRPNAQAAAAPKRPTRAARRRRRLCGTRSHRRNKRDSSHGQRTAAPVRVAQTRASHRKRERQPAARRPSQGPPPQHDGGSSPLVPILIAVIGARRDLDRRGA